MRIVRIIIAVISITLIAWQFRQQPSSPTVTSSTYRTATLLVGQQTVRVKIPLTAAASEQGLGGVSSLTDTEGMYWEFTEPTRPTFWMKGMIIPLDFLWIRDGAVTEITPNVPVGEANNLPLYQPNDPITNVLEVPAGFAQRHGIVVGAGVSVE